MGYRIVCYLLCKQLTLNYNHESYEISIKPAINTAFFFLLSFQLAAMIKNMANMEQKEVVSYANKIV